MKTIIVLILLFGLGLADFTEDDINSTEVDAQPQEEQSQDDQPQKDELQEVQDEDGVDDEDTDLDGTPLSDAKPWNVKRFPRRRWAGCWCKGARRRGYRYCHRRRNTWGCQRKRKRSW